MADPWYQTLFLLLPHLLLIPSIILSYTRRMPIVFVQLIVTFIFSSSYHLCKSTDACLFGGSLLSWTQLDYIYAFSQILVIFILLLLGSFSTNSIKWFTEMYGLKYAKRQQFWTTIIVLALIAFDILIVLTRLQSLSTPLTQQTAYIIIAAAAAGVLIKITLIDEGKFNIFSRYDTRYLLVGGLLLIPAIIFFLLESPTYYWIYHSLWHIFAFIAIFFLILGSDKGKNNKKVMTVQTYRTWKNKNMYGDVDV